MREALVLAERLGKSYPSAGGGSAEILKDVDCTISEGDLIALVGPSGSGKSTLLHTLGGLIEPTSGRVAWPALGPRETLLPERIQLVFQSPSLFPALDAVQNVALPLLLAGRGSDTEIEARAHEMLDRFDLAELAKKLPEELSGGQAQRVAMARALAIRPKLVLADEPTGQLDSHTARIFLDTVLAIVRAEGAAMVIATHDPEIAELMDQHWIMHHGALRVPQIPRKASA